VGRVAKHYFSTEYGSYWWPRQKDSEYTSRTFIYGATQELDREEPIGEMLERDTRDTSRDFGFTEMLTQSDHTGTEAQNTRSCESYVEKGYDETRTGEFYGDEYHGQSGYPEEEKEVEIEGTDEKTSRTIHVLGSGPNGKFIAHCLAGLPNTPLVTLLLHRPLLMQQWHDEGETLRLLRDDKVTIRSGLNIESSVHFQQKDPQQRFPGFRGNLQHWAEPPDSTIDHLIVTTEGFTTTSALTAIKHRLGTASTICFIQDGLGIIENVNSLVFPDPHTRPSYILGNTSHVLQSNERKFTVGEKSVGAMFLTMVPRKLPKARMNLDPRYDMPLVRRLNHGWSPSSKYLMRTLSRAPELKATGLSMAGYYKYQLERVAVNAVIGPLSVVFDCSNDQLLYNYQATRTMKLLLREISLVIQSLPEASRILKIGDPFSALRLERVVLSVIGRTGSNTSSMLQSVRNGQKTNIDYYNGYLLKRAAELGIDCPRNEMIVSMVKAKQAMKNRERNSYIPFEEDS
jgi:2-dehydropantoate 2-reductase